ncbi:MAG: PAS domain S-box protein [Promethearchaeota archaeon]
MNIKLNKSIERFKYITEKSLMGIAILQDGVFRYFNEKFIEINGYSAEEIKSWAPNEFSKFIHTEDRAFVMEQARKKQVGNPDVLNQYKFRIIRKDGKIRWVEIFSKTINYEGYPADLVTINDISDKINAEKELKESEEKYRNILENMLEGYFETDLPGKLLYANAEFCKMLGFSKEELIGKDNQTFYDKKSREILSDIFRQVYKTGIPRPPSGLVKVRTIKNKLIYFEGILDLLYDSEGKKIGFYGLVRDVTERKIAEQQLKESEEKFRYLADHSLLGITILQDGVFKYFNKKVAETFGVSEEEIKNWGPGESIKFIHPDDRDLVMRQAFQVQRGECDDVFNYKYRILKKDGKIGWRESFSKSIIYEGRPAGFGIHIDITEKIEGEQKLKESKEKYLRAYNQAEFYKDLFIHDINNTLQSLYSSIQLIDIDLEDSRKNNSIQELIDIIYRQINRGTKLVSNVRKLSQLEEHENSLRKVDVFDVLHRSIKFLKNLFQDRNIQIKCDTFNKKILILGNDLIQDVFENILINSVRHNNNSIVEIIIKASEVVQNKIPYYRLEFIDNGIGIEDERKENVLTRADPDSKTTYGMGLGLSLVKKIIDNYDGKIWIEDKVEGDYSKGTNVILLIQKGDS